MSDAVAGVKCETCGTEAMKGPGLRRLGEYKGVSSPPHWEFLATCDDCMMEGSVWDLLDDQDRETRYVVIDGEMVPMQREDTK